MNIDSTPAGSITLADLFLGRLRNQTMESHKALEKLPVSASILSSQVTRESYGHYLSLMHDVVADTEKNIFPILQTVVPDLESRGKRISIEADLHYLGFEKDSFRAVFGGSEIFSEPFALGILYVIEGSSLGGRFIFNHVSNAIGVDENNGAAYFAGYGNKTGQLWKHFLQILTSYEAQNYAGDEIIEGAEYAFKAIHKHFSLYS